MLVGHVGLHTDDRFDALVIARLVEIENSVHVPVIGHAECALSVGDRLGN